MDKIIHNGCGKLPCDQLGISFCELFVAWDY